MRTLYEDYVRFYLLMDYSRDESEFLARRKLRGKLPEPKKQCHHPRKRRRRHHTHPTPSQGNTRTNADKEVPEKEDATIPEPEALDEQLLETKDLCERPEPKKPSNNADKEIPEKEDATIPEPKALDEQCRIPLEPMLQSMVQNVSDEEDNTWGNWTAQGKLQQAPSQAPTDKDQNRIARRMKVLLKNNYKCVSQARCQAESWIVSKKCLTKIELDKIKEECKDECCNPAGSSASATTPASLRRINAPISKAATEHSEIRRLLNLADGNSKSSEAATEHSEIPEAACLEANRPRKSGKGSFSQTQKMLYPGTNAKTTTQA